MTAEFRPTHAWTTAQIKETAQRLNATETVPSLESLLKQAMATATPKDLPAVFWVMDACIKQSPKLIHAVQNIVKGLPESIQPQIVSIVQHWVALRLVPAPFIPRTTYGYFHWKRVYREAAAAKTCPPSPPVTGLAVCGGTCAYCKDKLDIRFDDLRNDWVYVDGVCDQDNIPRHVNCMDLMQIMGRNG